ncbi:MAG: cbb3-type cytochrome oxidase assembly protein CcoS [Paracoccaceae bacterium]|nr:cbb3-type cytochrome oxidase assembly protein CcoS [Paracoccaceae bacterium]
MNILVILVPVSLVLSILGLLAFLWSIRHRQYDDLEGDAWRILLDDEQIDDDTTDGQKTGN